MQHVASFVKKSDTTIFKKLGKDIHDLDARLPMIEKKIVDLLKKENVKVSKIDLKDMSYGELGVTWFIEADSEISQTVINKVEKLLDSNSKTNTGIKINSDCGSMGKYRFYASFYIFQLH